MLGRKYFLVSWPPVPDIIGYIPRKISRYIWHSVGKVAEVTAHVANTRPKRSPISQVGLKILIIVIVECDNANGITLSKSKVETVDFPTEALYFP